MNLPATHNPYSPLGDLQAALDGADEDRALQALQEVIEPVMMALLRQDVDFLRLAERLASQVAASQRLITSPDGRDRACMLRTLVLCVAQLVQVLKHQAECDFELGNQACVTAIAACEEALAATRRLHASPDGGLEDEDEFQTVVSTYEAYGWLFRTLARSIGTELLIFAGKRRAYLSELAAVAKMAHDGHQRMAQRADPVAQMLAQMLHELAARMTRRLNYLRLQDNRQLEYLEAAGNKVFIVHGHDEAKWRELRDVLSDEFGLQGVVLKREANESRTVIEKFLEHAAPCGFAFAILTPDDFVKKQGSTYFQPRPNVMFELGWFFGRYGAHRACILKKKGVPLPSDLGGVLSLEFEDSIEECLRELRVELERAGLVAPRRRVAAPKARTIGRTPSKRASGKARGDSRASAS